MCDTKESLGMEVTCILENILSVGDPHFFLRT